MGEVLAIAGFDQAALLQVAQQAVIGLLQCLWRYAEALLASTQEEVGDVGGKPVFLFALGAPQAEAATVTLHAEQAFDPQLDALAPLLVRLAFQAETLEARGVSVERRIQAAGGLLQAAIGVSLERADLLTEIQRRTARQCQHGLQPGRFELIEDARRHAPRLAPPQYRTEVLQLRRIRRTNAQCPLAAEVSQVLARQSQALHLDMDTALAQATFGAHRNAQGSALTILQADRRLTLAEQAQLALHAQLHVELLLAARQVGQIQRQGGFVTTGKEARHRQFGDQRRGHHCLGLGHAEALVGPGLRHQAQLTVEVGDIQTDFALALVVKLQRIALQGDDQHTGIRTFATGGEAGVTAEGQAGDTPLRFDQLTVDIQLVSAIGLAPEEVGERIGRGVAGDVEDAHVHRGDQHMHGIGNAAVGVTCTDLDLQRLLGTHLFRRFQTHRQLARGTFQRQVQQADRAFRRDLRLALTRANHQSTEVEVVTRPFFVDGQFEGLTFGRHADLLPPQRTVAGLDQQVAVAGSRRGDGDLGHVARGVGRLVQRQLDLVGTHRTTVDIVLPAVAGPEAQAADQAGLVVHHLDPVRAPLHREADLGGVARGDLERLVAEGKELLVVVVTPAFAVGEAPEVVAALTHQTHVEVVSRQLVAGGVGHQNLEFGQAVSIDLLAVEQPAHTRQTLGGPYRLNDAAGNRTATGLLQAGLEDQTQRRLGVAPAVFRAQHGAALVVEIDLVELLVLAQIGLGDIAELIARQARHRFTQRTHIELPGQTIASGRRTIEVASGHRELGAVARRVGLVLALELQGHTLGQEVLNEEFVELRVAVTQVEQQLPAAGRGLFGERQLILIKAFIAGIPDELAADLLVRTAHLDTDRLGLDRATIGITQQAIE